MKLSPETIARVEEYIDAHKDEMIDMWRDFVDTRSDTLNKEKTEAMAAKLVKIFQAIGCTCETFEVSERSGPGIVAWWGKENPGTPVLFSGHYDTVPLKGEHPFTIDEENCAHGLGCLDMKGGIVMSIWIVKALQALGWHERPVKLVFVGDEENGHQFSTTKEFCCSIPAAWRDLQYGDGPCFQCDLRGPQRNWTGNADGARRGGALRQQLSGGS